MGVSEAKRRIMDVALDLFSVNGYEGTSVGMIADAVGIRKPSLYSHFKSKQDIFDTILKEETERFERASVFQRSDWTDAASQDVSVFFEPETAAEKIAEHFRLLIHDPQICRIRRLLTIGQFQNREIAEILEKHSYTDVLKYHTEMMKTLIGKDIFRGGDPELMAQEYFAPISIQLYRVDRNPSREAEAMENVRRHVRRYYAAYGTGKVLPEGNVTRDVPPEEKEKRILETERLFLREMTAEDFDALYRVLGDSDIMQHYPYTFDEARVRRWIDKNRERYAELGFGLWAVCLKQTGEMIGDCGLTMQNIDGKVCPEIGYHIRKDMQRKGYAKEAAAAVRDWTFANTPFGTVCSYMKAGNEASAKTAESYGAEKTGEYTDGDGLNWVYMLKKD